MFSRRCTRKPAEDVASQYATQTERIDISAAAQRTYAAAVQTDACPAAGNVFRGAHVAPPLFASAARGTPPQQMMRAVRWRAAVVNCRMDILRMASFRDTCPDGGAVAPTASYVAASRSRASTMPVRPGPGPPPRRTRQMRRPPARLCVQQSRKVQNSTRRARRGRRTRTNIAESTLQQYRERMAVEDEQAMRICRRNHPVTAFCAFARPRPATSKYTAEVEIEG
jgi:hypothetical protein